MMGENITKALNSKGELLSVDNIKDGLEGLVLVREGIFLWQNAEVTRKTLKELDKEITEAELNEIEGEYIRVISLESYLYQYFIENKFDEALMKIIYKDFVDESLLHIQTKMATNLIWTYDYKISLDVEGNVVVKEDMFVDQDKFDKQFGMGKYEMKIEDLEAYEREHYGVEI